MLYSYCIFIFLKKVLRKKKPKTNKKNTCQNNVDNI